LKDNITYSVLCYDFFFEFHPSIRYMKRMNVCTKMLWKPLKTIEPMIVISNIRITRRLLFYWKNTLQKNHILSFANTHQKMATDQLDWHFWYLLKIWISFINSCLGTKYTVTEFGGVKREQLHALTPVVELPISRKFNFGIIPCHVLSRFLCALGFERFT
jgi:hypothetical protein